MLYFLGFLKMPCGATNLEHARVLSIIGCILSGLITIMGCLRLSQDNNGLLDLAPGIVGFLVSALLVFGAHSRNRTAILVWMYLAIIDFILDIVIAGVTIKFLIDVKEASGHFEPFGPIEIPTPNIAGAVVAVIILIGKMIFSIWTIIVAIFATKEIGDLNNGFYSGI